MIKIIYENKQAINQVETGHAVRCARTSTKVTLEALAAELGFTKSYLSLLELGQGTLDDSKINQINEALERLTV